MNNVIAMPLPANIGIPLTPNNPGKRKVAYVKRISVKQIRRLMELGYTVVLK